MSIKQCPVPQLTDNQTRPYVMYNSTTSLFCSEEPKAALILLRNQHLNWATS